MAPRAQLRGVQGGPTVRKFGANACHRGHALSRRACILAPSAFEAGLHVPGPTASSDIDDTHSTGASTGLMLRRVIAPGVRGCRRSARVCVSLQRKHFQGTCGEKPDFQRWRYQPSLSGAVLAQILCNLRRSITSSSDALATPVPLQARRSRRQGLGPPVLSQTSGG